MSTTLIIAIVAVAWPTLRFVDEHIAHLRIGRQIVYVCVSVIGAAAVINPPAFASATSSYIDREATAAATWLVNSIEDVLGGPLTPSDHVPEERP